MLEKEHLRPIVSITNKDASVDMISTPVRKNNTIRYKGSRYTVPFETYSRFKTVSVRENNGELEIYEPSGKLLAHSPLAMIPGELIRSNNHMRDISDSIKQLMSDAMYALGNTAQAETFLEIIRKKRGRYVRDQLNLILKVAKTYEPEIIRLAILSCLDSKVDSANDFRDFADHLFHQTTVDQVLSTQKISLMHGAPKPNVLSIKVVQRKPEFYTNLIMDGGKSYGQPIDIDQKTT